MNILEFLLANWDSVLVVLAFLVLIVVLIRRGETKVLKTFFSALLHRPKSNSAAARVL